uniref:Uncharacterized protein n=1 Tax=Panagrolaimus sp. JU765 TaxID=591449 RepID=A0AC34R9H2_9BILA
MDPNAFAQALTYNNGTDTALTVAVDANRVIGPAQTGYRYFPFDGYDQTSLSVIKKASKVVQNGNETVLENVVHQGCTAHYKFGFVSLIVNIAYCNVNTSLTTDLNYSYSAKVGDELVAVKFINGTLETKTVRVVEFDECIKAFDPNYTFALEDEEQFCTESPFGAPDDMKMPDSLLFVAKDDAHLAGI